MNVDVTKEEIEIAICEQNTDLVNTSDNSYKILDFFKREPGILVTIITSMVTIVTVLLNFIANAIQKRYLNYWNISVDLIEYNTTEIIYQLCTSVIICFVGIFYIVLINILFSKYFSKKISVIQEKHAFKECKKLYYKIFVKSRILHVFITILEKTRIFRKYVIWSKLLMKSKKMLQQNSDSSEMLRKKLEKVRGVCKSEQRFLLLKLIVQLIVLTIILFLILLLFNTFLVTEDSYVFITVIMTLSVMLVYLGLGYFNGKSRINKKKIKDMVYKYLNDEGEWINFEYKSEYIKNNLKEYFTDFVLKRSLVMFSFTLIAFLVYFSVVFSQNAEEQKIFNIIEYKNESYVVLHKFENNLVLEKVTVSGNEIVIDTTNQTIISIEGVNINRQEFQKVERIRYTPKSD